MKSKFFTPLLALLITQNAAAQNATPLVFDGARTVILTVGKYEIPQNVWSKYTEIFIDMVNDIIPEVGFENWTGQNSWGPEHGSGTHIDDCVNQYIRLTIPGGWSNAYGPNYKVIRVRSSSYFEDWVY